MRSMYFAKGKTGATEKHELKVLAIVKALKKFRLYSLGIPFKIVTDCEVLLLATYNPKKFAFSKVWL